MRQRILLLIAIVVLIGGYASPAVAISQDDINSIVNNTPFYDPADTSCSDTGSTSTTETTTLTGSSNEQKAFNYYTGKGLSALDAAAIVGNFMQESGVNPTDGGGYIAQWGGGRLANLEALAATDTKPVTDLGVQLDFSWQELTGPYADVLQNLEAATNIDDAVNEFMGPTVIPGGTSGGYENPGDPQLQNRILYAQQALTLYGGSSANSGTTVTGGADCASRSISCPTSSTPTAVSDAGIGNTATRQKIVCLAQAELALWKAQPNYGASYPNFPFAQTGYLQYSEGRTEEWCADFVSWIYNQAGDSLGSGSDWDIPGVSSLQAAAQANTNFTWHPASSGYTPQPGDIAIHLDGESHTNIFISSSGGISTYIGGDQAMGPYPGGSIVSTEPVSGYYGEGITGYISPN